MLAHLFSIPCASKNLTACIFLSNRVPNQLKTKMFSENTGWWKEENWKPQKDRRDHAYFIIAELGVAEEWKEDYSNGNVNVIFREDYQKIFKKEVWYKNLQELLEEYVLSYHNHYLLKRVCKTYQQPPGTWAQLSRIRFVGVKSLFSSILPMNYNVSTNQQLKTHEM